MSHLYNPYVTDQQSSTQACNKDSSTQVQRDPQRTSHPNMSALSRPANEEELRRSADLSSSRAREESLLPHRSYTITPPSQGHRKAVAQSFDRSLNWLPTNKNTVEDDTSKYYTSTASSIFSEGGESRKSAASTIVSGGVENRSTTISERKPREQSIPGLSNYEFPVRETASAQPEFSLPMYTSESASNILLHFGLEEKDLDLLISYPEDQITPQNLPFILRQIRQQKTKNNVSADQATPYPEPKPTTSISDTDFMGHMREVSHQDYKPRGILKTSKVRDCGHISEFSAGPMEQKGMGSGAHSVGSSSLLMDSSGREVREMRKNSLDSSHDHSALSFKLSSKYFPTNNPLEEFPPPSKQAPLMASVPFTISKTDTYSRILPGLSKSLSLKKSEVSQLKSSKPHLSDTPCPSLHYDGLKDPHQPLKQVSKVPETKQKHQLWVKQEVKKQQPAAQRMECTSDVDTKSFTSCPSKSSKKRQNCSPRSRSRSYSPRHHSSSGSRRDQKKSRNRSRSRSNSPRQSSRRTHRRSYSRSQSPLYRSTATYYRSRSRSNERRSSLRRPDDRRSSGKRSREQSSSKKSSAHQMPSFSTEAQAQKLLGSSAIQALSNQSDLEAMVKTLAPVLLAELLKMKSLPSSSSSSSASKKNPKTTGGTLSGSQTPAQKRKKSPSTKTGKSRMSSSLSKAQNVPAKLVKVPESGLQKQAADSTTQSSAAKPSNTSAAKKPVRQPEKPAVVNKQSQLDKGTTSGTKAPAADKKDSTSSEKTAEKKYKEAAGKVEEPPKKVDEPPKKVDEHPKKVYEPPKKVDEPPKKVDEHPKKVDEPPKKVDEHPKKVEEPPKKVDEHPKKVDEHPKKVDEPPKKVDEPPKKVDEHPKKVEEPPKKLDEHPKKLDEHPNKVDEHPKKVDEHPKKVDEPPKKVDEPPKKVDEPPKKVDEPPKKVDEPPKKVDEPPKKVDEPPKKVDEPPKKVDEPPKKVDEPPKKVEEPPKKVEEPPKKVEEPVGPSIKSTLVEVLVKQNPQEEAKWGAFDGGEEKLSKEAADGKQKMELTMGEMLGKNLLMKRMACVEMKSFFSPESASRNKRVLQITNLPTFENGNYTERDVANLLSPFGFQHENEHLHNIYVIPQKRMALAVMPTAEMVINIIRASAMDCFRFSGCKLIVKILEDNFSTPMEFYMCLMKWMNQNISSYQPKRIVFIKKISLNEARNLRDILKKIGNVKNYIPLLNKVFIEFFTIPEADCLGVRHSLLRHPPQHFIYRLEPPRNNQTAERPNQPENVLPDLSMRVTDAAIPKIFCIPQDCSPPFYVTMTTYPFIFPTNCPWFNIPPFINRAPGAGSTPSRCSTIMLTGLPEDGYCQMDVARMVWSLFPQHNLHSLFYRVMVLPLQRRAFINFNDPKSSWEFSRRHVTKPFCIKNQPVSVHFVSYFMNPGFSEENMYRQLMKLSNNHVPELSGLDQRLLVVLVSEVSLDLIQAVMKEVVSVGRVAGFLPLGNRICVEMSEPSDRMKVMEAKLGSLTDPQLWTKVIQVDMVQNMYLLLQTLHPLLEALDQTSQDSNQHPSSSTKAAAADMAPDSGSAPETSHEMLGQGPVHADSKSSVTECTSQSGKEESSATDSSKTLLDADSSKTLLDADSSKTLLDADSSKTLLDADSSKTLLDADSSKTLLDIDSSKTLLDADSSKTLLDTDSSKTLLDADSSKTLLDADSSKTLLDADSSKTLLDADSSKTLLDADSSKTLLDTDSSKTLLDADSSKTLLDADSSKTLLDADSSKTLLDADSSKTLLDAYSMFQQENLKVSENTAAEPGDQKGSTRSEERVEQESQEVADKGAEKPAESSAVSAVKSMINVGPNAAAADCQQNPELTPGEMLGENLLLRRITYVETESIFSPEFASRNKCVVHITNLPKYWSGNYTERHVTNLLTPFGFQHETKCLHNIYVIPQKCTAFAIMPTTKMAIKVFQAFFKGDFKLCGFKLFVRILEDNFSTPMEFYMCLMKWMNQKITLDQAERVVLIKNISPFETENLRDKLKNLCNVKNYTPLLNKVFIEFNTIHEADCLRVWFSHLRLPCHHFIYRLGPSQDNQPMPPPDKAPNVVMPTISSIPEGCRPPFYVTMTTFPFIFSTSLPSFNIPRFQNASEVSTASRYSTLMITGLPEDGYHQRDVERLLYKRNIYSLFYRVMVLPLQRRALVYFTDPQPCWEFFQLCFSKQFYIKNHPVYVYLLNEHMSSRFTQVNMYRQLMKISNAHVPLLSGLDQRLLMVHISEVSLELIQAVMKEVTSVGRVAGFLPLGNRICVEMLESSDRTKVMKAKLGSLTDPQLWKKVTGVDIVQSLCQDQLHSFDVTMNPEEDLDLAALGPTPQDPDSTNPIPSEKCLEVLASTAEQSRSPTPSAELPQGPTLSDQILQGPTPSEELPQGPTSSVEQSKGSTQSEECPECPTASNQPKTEIEECSLMGEDKMAILAAIQQHKQAKRGQVPMGFTADDRFSDRDDLRFDQDAHEFMTLDEVSDDTKNTAKNSQSSNSSKQHFSRKGQTRSIQETEKVGRRRSTRGNKEEKITSQTANIKEEPKYQIIDSVEDYEAPEEVVTVTRSTRGRRGRTTKRDIPTQGQTAAKECEEGKETSPKAEEMAVTVEEVIYKTIDSVKDPLLEQCEGLTPSKKYLEGQQLGQEEDQCLDDLSFQVLDSIDDEGMAEQEKNAEPQMDTSFQVLDSIAEDQSPTDLVTEVTVAENVSDETKVSNITKRPRRGRGGNRGRKPKVLTANKDITDQEHVEIIDSVENPTKKKDPELKIQAPKDVTPEAELEPITDEEVFQVMDSVDEQSEPNNKKKQGRRGRPTRRSARSKTSERESEEKQDETQTKLEAKKPDSITNKEEANKVLYTVLDSAENETIQETEKVGRRRSTRGNKEEKITSQTANIKEEPKYQVIDSVEDYEAPEEVVMVTRSTRGRRGRTAKRDIPTRGQTAAKECEEGKETSPKAEETAVTVEEVIYKTIDSVKDEGVLDTSPVSGQKRKRGRPRNIKDTNKSSNSKKTKVEIIEESSTEDDYDKQKITKSVCEEDEEPTHQIVDSVETNEGQEETEDDLVPDSTISGTIEVFTKESEEQQDYTNLTEDENLESSTLKRSLVILDKEVKELEMNNKEPGSQSSSREEHRTKEMERTARDVQEPLTLDVGADEDPEPKEDLLMDDEVKNRPIRESGQSRDPLKSEILTAEEKDDDHRHDDITGVSKRRKDLIGPEVKRCRSQSPDVPLPTYNPNNPLVVNSGSSEVSQTVLSPPLYS